jgi:RNA-directed DNA polymerase
MDILAYHANSQRAMMRFVPQRILWPYRPIPELDHWLQRRVRMCYWKQWRYVRTKVKHLLALGTGKRQAILTAISSKSYWRLSRTLATQTGMTNQWLKTQGLISIRDLWMKAHGYA